MTRTTPELPSPFFRTIPTGGYLAPTDLTCTRPSYTAVLRWNRDSNLEPSGPEVEILPPGTCTGDCACGIYKMTNFFCTCRK
ncbi:hypothetical protein AVEN_176857-1 [Araneus ventricosus]|uniref:Uncharacterized protein n=1 Tax=Araneus ventricosus TaxID=182803 RepID=A0A4Y2V8B5_ARAVE|nr:hypothetical protein AVEN_112340-1 [Araneus ventricosus]GBO20808.1 hypothetical protein AVEN_176857-1 [Araneus ventricosus]